MPTKPPIVENTNPHIESIEALHRLGTSPPSVEPMIAPIQISRLALTQPSYRESAPDSTGGASARHLRYLASFHDSEGQAKARVVVLRWPSQKQWPPQ
jgi:hypothetical protein